MAIRNTAGKAVAPARVKLTVVSRISSCSGIGPISDVQLRPCAHIRATANTAVHLALNEDRRVSPIKINANARAGPAPKKWNGYRASCTHRNLCGKPARIVPQQWIVSGIGVEIGSAACKPRRVFAEEPSRLRL